MASIPANPETEPPSLVSPLSAEFLATVSHGPGIYQMLSKKQVLYVGKARDLRKRLSQYAHFSGPIHSKTAVMLSHVQRVETILTTTEKEALILEASLIKQHRPRYNVILRDDKNYPLIKVTTRDPWPRVVVTRKRLRDGNRYFGPYASGTAMRATLQLLYAQFPLRRCKTVRERTRPCLNFQMGRCLAPCAGLVDHAEYQRMVRDVLLILEGKVDEVVRELTAKMEQAAEQLAFEKAARYRDQIRGLTRTIEHQAVVADHHLDQDVFGIHRQDASVGIALLFVRGGMITGAQSFFLADPLGEDDSLLAQTILQYYSVERQPPRELLLPFVLEDRDLIGERLAELREGPVSLLAPQRGKRMQLMRMAEANAAQIFSEKAKKEQSWEALATGLQAKLRLANRPEIIECLDISNLQGKQAVGSLVCFVQGDKAAKRFRHYRIRSQDTPDDYAMMREVLERRMAKGVAEDNLPDLLLLDGGKGQLQVAVDVLGAFDLLSRVDLMAIAKEKQEEGEKLFRPGRKNPVLLPAHSPVLLYLMRIRDEAHRFGITFHRRLRGKAQLRSQLDAIDGIGPKRKQMLLHTLGSVRRIAEAGIEELAEVPGIGPELAKQIYSQLHGADHEPG
ncbi:Excinuclease ABC subunit C [Desulfobulbus propionicus DSM 2032]|uniref:UvrABC system protein C n=1 Tax=Desulfobulbus propionicus (strain ATCC 33891 / DSM 2032 / VKM B-1956 / 1pr3) TaxID=577650 RepID=A0A7U3YJX6_DESPD|nr:excinuclease ABC subunit UvrC [Desulfobulbus propionicus]ADW16628.1 Excinuclease ABC subunit C [Desulfobulbus propionicus DSM 2032]